MPAIAAHPSTFIDREAEVRDFLFDLNEVRQNRPTIHGRIITGTELSGKSRILEELINRANNVRGISTHRLVLSSVPTQVDELYLINWIADILDVDKELSILARLNAIVIINRNTNECIYLQSPPGQEVSFKLRTRFVNDYILTYEEHGEIPPARTWAFLSGGTDLHFDFSDNWLVSTFFDEIIDESEIEPFRIVLRNIIIQLDANGMSEELRNLLNNQETFRRHGYQRVNPITIPYVTRPIFPEAQDTTKYAVVEKIVSELITRRDALGAVPPLNVIVFGIDDIHLARYLDCSVVNTLIGRFEDEKLPIYIVATLSDNSIFQEFKKSADMAIIQLFDNRRKKYVSPLDREATIELCHAFQMIISQREDEFEALDPDFRLYDLLYMPEQQIFNTELVGSKRFPGCIWCALTKHYHRINNLTIDSPFKLRIDCDRCNL